MCVVTHDTGRIFSEGEGMRREAMVEGLGYGLGFIPFSIDPTGSG